MWVPRTLAGLRAGLAADAAKLQEGTRFDAKRELPAKGKTTDLAIDVAAMSTEGGVLVYGLEENKQAGTLTERPFALAGAVERVDAIVSSLVMERPDFEAFVIETAPGFGLLVVAVPPSPRAPHMVQVKGEWRYYGRGPGGNRPLNEAEVARLYERRNMWRRDTATILDEVVGNTPTPGAQIAHLHILFRPLLADSGLRERVVPASDIERGLRNLVLAVTNRLRFVEPWSPELSHVVGGSILSRVVDGYALVVEAAAGRQTELHVSDAGEVRVYTTGAADARSSQATDGQVFTLRDGTLAHFATQTAALAGHLATAGGYIGAVDGACVVVGAREASSALVHDFTRGSHLDLRRPPPLPDPYRRGGRWAATKLRDEPIAVAWELIEPLLHAARQGGVAELFALKVTN